MYTRIESAYPKSSSPGSERGMGIMKIGYAIMRKVDKIMSYFLEREVLHPSHRHNISLKILEGFFSDRGWLLGLGHLLVFVQHTFCHSIHNIGTDARIWVANREFFPKFFDCFSPNLPISASLLPIGESNIHLGCNCIVLPFSLTVVSNEKLLFREAIT